MGIFLSSLERPNKQNKPFDTFEKYFDSREEVELWMRRNAASRRNLTPEQISYNTGRIYELRKKGIGGDRKSGHQNDALIGGRTSELVAKELGVGKATIDRDAQFARAVDTLAENTGIETRQAILSGELKVTKQDVVAIAQLPEEEQLGQNDPLAKKERCYGNRKSGRQNDALIGKSASKWRSYRKYS
jgi:hypothetical protein